MADEEPPAEAPAEEAAAAEEPTPAEEAAEAAPEGEDEAAAAAEGGEAGEAEEAGGEPAEEGGEAAEGEAAEGEEGSAEGGEGGEGEETGEEGEPAEGGEETAEGEEAAEGEAAAEDPASPSAEPAEPAAAPAADEPAPAAAAEEDPAEAAAKAAAAEAATKAAAAEAAAKAAHAAAEAEVAKQLAEAGLTGDATAIEGFDDDFQVPDDESEAGRSHYSEFQPTEAEEALRVEEEEEAARAVEMDSRIADAREEQERLQAHLQELQRRIMTCGALASYPHRKGAETLDVVDGQDTRYIQALGQWIRLKEDKERLEANYEQRVHELKERLEEKMSRSNDVSDTFMNFKLEVMRAAEHSQTGQPLSDARIDGMVHQQRLGDEEVKTARLRNIMLRNQMVKLEQRIKSKEELAEGLHLIDFEQLKIENQSLNEKIEERSEELLKLRKKTTTTVQVLTHLKEKLQFVEKDNARHEDALRALEGRLAVQRDQLVHSKLRRDQLRTECLQLKSQCSIVTAAVLKEDIALHRERRDGLHERVMLLQSQHKSLTGTLQRLRSALGTPNAPPGMIDPRTLAPGGRTAPRFATVSGGAW